MGFSEKSKGYFCKIVISMEVQEVVMEEQEVVMEMQEESLLTLNIPWPRPKTYRQLGFRFTKYVLILIFFFFSVWLLNR